MNLIALASWIGLALAAAPAAATAESASPAAGPAAEDAVVDSGRGGDPSRQLRVFLDGTPIGSIDVFSDGHFNGQTSYSGGFDGDLLWAPTRNFRLGVGARYELAYGSSRPISAFTDHFLYVPLLIGGTIPFGGENEGRRELELLLGVGVMTGLVQGGSTSDGSSFMQTIGPYAEMGVTYWTPISRTLDLSVGAAVRVAILDIQNGGDYFTGRAGGKALIPLRLGVRWHL